MDNPTPNNPSTDKMEYLILENSMLRKVYVHEKKKNETSGN
jgi:hypothetical protein